MKIQQLNSFANNYSLNKQKSIVNTNNTTAIFSNRKQFSSLSNEAIKANFTPSFKSSETKIISLKDRETNKDVEMKLTKISIGDYTSFKIHTMKNKEAGFLRLKSRNIMKEDLTLTDEMPPVILELRSLAGDKYKGIGTTLINEAIKESDKLGKGGCLWLRSLKGFGSSMSKYRSDENPIPFYYKMGFVSIYKSVDEQIRNCLANDNISDLPNDVILVLKPEVAKEKLNELKS